ncbi:MAG TPA: hypothetical protein VFY78_06955 [Gammaproteobacteria bacterium]|nr:hypothetical protein [Gammaproteobacteria bacterium]
MKKTSLLASALVAAMSLPVGVVFAADQVKDQDKLQDKDQLQDQTRDQIQDQDRIYGSQLMTDQERLEYQNKMRAAKTTEEQAKIRNEHHERMKVRAREKGVTIPDKPPYPGGGMGPGGGGGMGPGGGGGKPK